MCYYFITSCLFLFILKSQFEIHAYASRSVSRNYMVAKQRVMAPPANAWALISAIRFLSNDIFETVFLSRAPLSWRYTLHTVCVYLMLMSDKIWKITNDSQINN